LFLVFEYDDKTNSLLLKRKKRGNDDKEIYLAANLICTENEMFGKMEYEIDKRKNSGRGNIGILDAVKNSTPFSKKNGLVTEGMVALRRTVKIKSHEDVELNFVISVGENKQLVLENINQYQIKETINKAFEVSKAQVEAQSRD